MERSGIDFEVSMDENLGSVLVDAEQIEQVVVNLLCNAREAATSRVTLRARRESDPAGDDRPARVVLEVADDGAGVRPELHERIFEPFFTTKAQGTGLGLAIARDLARLNGGEVELYESSPRGTTFALYLVEADGPHALGDALS
ncbi:MAG: ATP-binding protein [Polyangiales bacterium]